MLLKEIRSNPEKNVKISPLEEMQQILSASSNPKNLFVTFTLHKKFGTNPKSSFQTPLGLYSYPLSYVVENKMKVPYAGECPHVWVFEANDCWDIAGPFREDIYKNIRRIARTDMGFDLDNMLEFAETNKQVYDGLQRTLKFEGYSKKGKNPNVMLRKIFMSAGINGIVDFGTATIHVNEPTQMVYFKISNLKIISYIPNRLEIKQQRPSSDTIAPEMTFSQYYDSVVMGSNKRDVNIEQKLIFDHEPTDNEMRKFIIKSMSQRAGRIQFLEKYFAKDAYVSVMYARDVLQQRFLRGEPVIRKDKTMWDVYTKRFPQLTYSSR